MSVAVAYTYSTFGLPMHACLLQIMQVSDAPSDLNQV